MYNQNAVCIQGFNVPGVFNIKRHVKEQLSIFLISDRYINLQTVSKFSVLILFLSDDVSRCDHPSELLIRNLFLIAKPKKKYWLS